MTEQLTPKQNLAVDIVAISFDTESRELKYYAPVRNLPYATGERALPGTLLNEGEDVTSAIYRVLETKFATKPTKYVSHTLSPMTDPNRDPRGHVISLPVILFVPGGELDSDWLNLTDGCDLAFDHAQIVENAIDYIKLSLSDTPKVLAALPDMTYIKDARDAYAQMNSDYDKSTSNFTQQTNVLDYLIDTGQRLQTGKRGGQPVIYKVDLDKLR